MSLDRIVRRLAAKISGGARKLLDTEWPSQRPRRPVVVAMGWTRRRPARRALPNPLGRMVMLNHLRVGERAARRWRAEHVAGRMDSEAGVVTDARLDGGLPVWEYTWDGMRIEKRVLMPYKQNTVHVQYRLIDGPATATLELEPAIHFRGYEDPVNTARNAPSKTRYGIAESAGIHVIAADDVLPPLRLQVVGAATMQFIGDERLVSELVYPVEHDRGYEYTGALWVPGRFRIEMNRDQCVTLVASVEEELVMRSLTPDDVSACEYERRRRLIESALPQAQDEVGAELVWADHPLTPKGRMTTRGRQLGNRTVIAGITGSPTGPGTMISLEG